MKNYAVKQTALCLFVATLLLLNAAVFSAEAGADNSANTETSKPANQNEDGNVPDDQLALPISLAQFQNLQTIVQKHTEENVKAIDALTKDNEEFTKKFNEFVDDLLKEPTAAPAA